MSRTLLDIIRDDSEGTTLPYDEQSCGNKKSWRSFKEKLRLRRAGGEWTSSLPIPASDVPIRRRQMSRRESARFQVESPEDDAGDSEFRPVNRMQMTRMTSSRFSSGHIIADEAELGRRLSGNQLEAALQRERLSDEDDGGREEDEPPETAQAAGDGERPPVRMSLMALLEETDRQMGVVGPAYMAAYGGDEEEEEVNEDDGGMGDYSCCVCMVRHKGAAFIPCGHTFCRLCSRELWVSRGNCPICNGFILEILDIF